jgi:hypothetical protein
VAYPVWQDEGTVNWPQWGIGYVECAEVWLCGCHHLSAYIPGESQSFLNDPRIWSAWI